MDRVYAKPANADSTLPPAGEEWKDIDKTIFLDTGTGAHIQLVGKPTGTGNTAGAYIYSILSSTGSTTSISDAVDLQNTVVKVLRMEEHSLISGDGRDSGLAFPRESKIAYARRQRNMVSLHS